MSTSPREVLQRFYQAEAKYMKTRNTGERADFAAMRETLSPEVVLHQSPDLPFGGEYHGHEGYERWAVSMSNIFDRLEVAEQEFFENGDAVVVICRFRTRSRQNGSSQDLPMVQVVRLEGERIIEFRPFYWNVPAYVAAAVFNPEKR